jgi:LysM repeat protein
MIAPVGAPDASESEARPAHDALREPELRPAPEPTPRETAAGLCPYLTSSAGAWRQVTPSRDHRCAAIDPPASQPSDKQRRHCLSTNHVECTTFRAARSARATTLAGSSDPALVEVADRRRRPIARTAPVLLERPRLIDQAIRLQFERGPGQLALIGLMVVAFAIVALTRLSAGNGSAASPSPNASSVAVAPSSTPRPTPSATPSGTSSSGPSTSPGPSFRTTYKVKKGDTLLAIAKTFKTTAAKIKALNGLKSSTLHIGQVLKIP